MNKEQTTKIRSKYKITKNTSMEKWGIHFIELLSDTNNSGIWSRSEAPMKEIKDLLREKIEKQFLMSKE